MKATRLEWIISGLDCDRLTPWEEKFIEDIQEKFETYGDLTPAQEDKLEEIFKQKGR